MSVKSPPQRVPAGIRGTVVSRSAPRTIATSPKPVSQPPVKHASLFRVLPRVQPQRMPWDDWTKKQQRLVATVFSATVIVAAWLAFPVFKYSGLFPTQATPQSGVVAPRPGFNVDETENITLEECDGGVMITYDVVTGRLSFLDETGHIKPDAPFDISDGPQVTSYCVPPERWAAWLAAETDGTPNKEYFVDWLMKKEGLSGEQWKQELMQALVDSLSYKSSADYHFTDGRVETREEIGAILFLPGKDENQQPYQVTPQPRSADSRASGAVATATLPPLNGLPWNEATPIGGFLPTPTPGATPTPVPTLLPATVTPTYPPEESILNNYEVVDLFSLVYNTGQGAEIWQKVSRLEFWEKGGSGYFEAWGPDRQNPQVHINVVSNLGINVPVAGYQYTWNPTYGGGMAYGRVDEPTFAGFDAFGAETYRVNYDANSPVSVWPSKKVMVPTPWPTATPRPWPTNEPPAPTWTPSNTPPPVACTSVSWEEVKSLAGKFREAGDTILNNNGRGQWVGLTGSCYLVSGIPGEVTGVDGQVYVWSANAHGATIQIGSNSYYGSQIVQVWGTEVWVSPVTAK